ncbi:MAG: hypothetical protein HY434_01765 [Candidatus Liptonbacteria bacterium]|nr:hypothetical protein [Candidatus Liptonbacteria bacterium]
MRWLVFALTILAIGFFAHNLIGKKGTFWHIARGLLAFLLPLAVVVINTVSVSSARGPNWDAVFYAHFWLGVLFFLSLLYTIFYGYRMKRSVPHSPEYVFRKKFHRIFAYSSAIFLFCSLAFAVVMRFVR